MPNLSCKCMKTDANLARACACPLQHWSPLESVQHQRNMLEPIVNARTSRADHAFKCVLWLAFNKKLSLAT
eukprot:10268250-Lingulodinium_polyedra.AAC.1